MVDLVTSILAASLQLTMPILLAATGETFAERSGVLNMGIEGTMTLSAFVSLWATFVTGSYVFGILGAITAGAILGLLHTFACVRIGANQLIVGLLVYTLGTSIADFSYRKLTAVTVPLIRPLSALNIPLLSRIPVLGPVLFQQNVFVYATFCLAVVMGLILYKTTWGLKVRSVGENPEAADSAGINVNLVRHLCVILGAILAGVAGASLTIGYLGIYNTGDTLVAGRGWIAIVVVIFARWSPYRAILGSWIFGLGYSIAATLIGAGTFASGGSAVSYLLLLVPYIFALVVILVLHRGTRPPSYLTVPYKRK